MSEVVAEKTATELDDYPDQTDRHLSERKELLDLEGSDNAS